MKGVVPEIPPKRRLRPWIISIFTLISGLFLAFSSFVKVVDVKNGEFFTAKYFIAENPYDHPRLKLLREREKLDQVMAPGKSQFEKIVLLRKWVRSQWEGAQNFYYPPWDAVEILDLARKHKNYGFCAQYAIVLLQAYQAVGFRARYVDLPGHFTVAVWSNEHNRWVIMDPTADIHYEENGMPLRGGDLYRAYWHNDIGGIYRVGSDGSRKPVSRTDIEHYKGYSIVTRADQLTHPVVITVNGKSRRLTLESDYRRYPYVGKDILEFPLEILGWKDGDVIHMSEKSGVYSDNPDDFRQAMNQTMIFLARNNRPKGTVKVKLIVENSPTFQHFMFNIDKQGWRVAGHDSIFWTLKPGMNTLEARIQTRFGWDGPVSSIKLFYKPRWIQWGFLDREQASFVNE